MSYEHEPDKLQYTSDSLLTVVGIVDSGCRPEQPVLAQQAFYLDGDQLTIGKTRTDQLDHGSRILDIMLAQAPDIICVVAQVFTDRWLTSAAQVAAAIEWLIEQQVQLINLSLGLRQDRLILRMACAQAIAQGIIVCASTPARGKPVYPAAYPGVLRITGDARCQPHQFTYLNSRYADYAACVRVAGATVAGASVGCAYMSAHIARYLSQGGTPAELHAGLKRQAAFIGPEQRSV